MLASLTPLLVNPLLNHNSTNLQLVEFEQGANGHVNDGVLICSETKQWFFIQNEKAELLSPELAYVNDKQQFINKYEQRLKDLGLTIVIDQDIKQDVQDQIKQREHYDSFAEGDTYNYDTFEKEPFWNAVDEAVFTPWKANVKSDTVILDVGCGNGRSTFRVADKNVTIVGIDISKKLLNRAIQRSKEKGFYSHQSFLLSDGNRLPFKDGMFDYVITSGVLSQVPNPELTCNEIQRVLKPGGAHWGFENNKSAFRILFDAFKRLFKNWENVKGNIPEFNQAMLTKWVQKSGAVVRSKTTVFLPPTAFNILGFNGAKKVYKISDTLFKLIPGFSANGGLIIFEIQKKQ